MSRGLKNRGITREELRQEAQDSLETNNLQTVIHSLLKAKENGNNNEEVKLEAEMFTALHRFTSVERERRLELQKQGPTQSLTPALTDWFKYVLELLREELAEPDSILNIYQDIMKSYKPLEEAQETGKRLIRRWRKGEKLTGCILQTRKKRP